MRDEAGAAAGAQQRRGRSSLCGGDSSVSCSRAGDTHDHPTRGQQPGPRHSVSAHSLSSPTGGAAAGNAARGWAGGGGRAALHSWSRFLRPPLCRCCSLLSRPGSHRPGFPAPQRLPDFAQTRVLRRDTIQPPSASSCCTFCLSQHQGRFQYFRLNCKTVSLSVCVCWSESPTLCQVETSELACCFSVVRLPCFWKRPHPGASRPQTSSPNSPAPCRPSPSLEGVPSRTVLRQHGAPAFAHIHLSCPHLAPSHPSTEHPQVGGGQRKLGQGASVSPALASLGGRGGGCGPCPLVCSQPSTPSHPAHLAGPVSPYADEALRFAA